MGSIGKSFSCVLPSACCALAWVTTSSPPAPPIRCGSLCTSTTPPVPAAAAVANASRCAAASRKSKATVSRQRRGDSIPCMLTNAASLHCTALLLRYTVYIQSTVPGSWIVDSSLGRKSKSAVHAQRPASQQTPPFRQSFAKQSVLTRPQTDRFVVRRH